MTSTNIPSSLDSISDCSHIPNYQLFQTGDLLLFSDKKFIPSRAIEDLTHSKYSHTGMILKDPKFPDESLEGLYILESTGYIDAKDVEDHKYKVGVQINKLSKVYDVTNGEIYWRRLTTDRNENFYQVISEVHKITHGKGYDFDPSDWIKSYFDWHFGNEQKENVFVCSALMSFLYNRLGFLEKPVEWTIVRPVDFGTEYQQKDRRIKVINCELDSEIQIRFMNPEDPTKPLKIDTKDSAEESWSVWFYICTQVGYVASAVTGYKRD